MPVFLMEALQRLLLLVVRKMPLMITDYDFALPAGAVYGIEVAVYGRVQTLSAYVNAQLTKNGTATVGNTKLVGLSSGVFSEIVVGGDGDLWGTTFTSSEINATTFGVQIYEVNTHPTDSLTIEIDYVFIKVYSADTSAVTQVAYPDADTDASTWTVTPLWSKVDEPTTPSDADFITGVAS